MKKASIISIGNEILNGQIVDTNAAYLSERLLSIGIPVVGSYTIGDDVDSIVRALKLASEDVDVVLVTGGLGATDDDVTRQALAKFLGSELQLQNEVLKDIQNAFVRRERSMCERDKIQAYIPEGAKALENKLGIAPGIAAENRGKLFFVLPGVPAEMKEMFEEQVLPELETAAAGQAIVVRKLKCFGAGESAIADLVGDVMERGRNPLINCTAEHGVITLHIVATAPTSSCRKTGVGAERMAEKDEKMLRKCLGELVYGVGEQTLAEVVGEELARQKKTIAVAESCTGGRWPNL